MDEIRSDLSVSIQVVSGKCIFSCNNVLKVVATKNKKNLHKADGVNGYLLMILKKLGMISLCMSHCCCQAY